MLRLRPLADLLLLLLALFDGQLSVAAWVCLSITTTTAADCCELPLLPLPPTAHLCLQVTCPTHQVKMLTEMLESYQREIQSLEGSINEAEEDLDNTR